MFTTVILVTVKGRVIQLYDSLHQRRDSITIVIHEYAKQLSRHFGTPDIDFTIANKEVISVQQGNHYDCGCFAIWNLIRYVLRKPFAELPADFRPLLALWILTQDHGVRRLNF